MQLRTLAAVVVTLADVTIIPDQRPLSGQKLSDAEERIKKAAARPNGIVVGDPKVYDDALLQQMLRAAQAGLAALQMARTRSSCCTAVVWRAPRLPCRHGHADDVSRPGESAEIDRRNDARQGDHQEERTGRA